MHKSRRLLLMLFFAFALLLSACAEEATDDTAEEAIQGEAANVPLAAISTDPSEFVGQVVTVNGEVLEVLSPEALVLQSEEVPESMILVVGTEPESFVADSIVETDVLQVTGEVRVFDRADLEEEVGLTLQEEQYAAWEGRAVLLAATTDLVPLAREEDLFELGVEEAVLEEEIEEGVDPGQVDVLPLDELVSQAEAFIGQQVTVGGQIDEVLDSSSFVMTSDTASTNGVVVLSRDPAGFDADFLGEENLVLVTGEVRQFTDVTQEEWGTELEGAIAERFADSLVLLAESISPVP